MQRFDMRHLDALQALLETQSVSLAAERMGVTPSAMSRSLSKIRSLLDDDILTPAGRSLILTSRGQLLKDKIKSKVDDLQHLLIPPEAFNPANMKRQFHILANSYSEMLVVESLVPALAKEAPQSCIIIHPESDENMQPLRDGRADLRIGAASAVNSELMTQTLAQDRHVAVYCKAKFKSPKISLDEFCETPHLIVSRKGQHWTIVDDELKKLGRKRQIMAVLATYSEAFETAARVKCIVTTPLRFFERSGPRYRLAQSPLPFKTPPLEVIQTWHPRNQDDPEHKWVRQTFKELLNIKK